MTQNNEQRLSSKNIIITRLLLYEMAVYTCVLRNQVGKPKTAYAEPLSRVHNSLSTYITKVNKP